MRHDLASGPISEGYKVDCSSNLVRLEKCQRILLVKTLTYRQFQFSEVININMFFGENIKLDSYVFASKKSPNTVRTRS